MRRNTKKFESWVHVPTLDSLGLDGLYDAALDKWESHLHRQGVLIYPCTKSEKDSILANGFTNEVTSFRDGILDPNLEGYPAEYDSYVMVNVDDVIDRTFPSTSGFTIDDAWILGLLHEYLPYSGGNVEYSEMLYMAGIELDILVPLWASQSSTANYAVVTGKISPELIASSGNFQDLAGSGCRTNESNFVHLKRFRNF